MQHNRIYEVECETAEDYTVGTPIWRSNASGLKAHGQFGAIDEAPWSAKEGHVLYGGIDFPYKGILMMRLRYSKHNSTSVPIDVYIDDQLRASFYPVDQGDWNSFAWSDSIHLGEVRGGEQSHTLRLSTRGEKYGTADLDKLILELNPPND